MKNQKVSSSHLYADGEYSREQLHNVLKAAGYVVTDNTFRNLKVKENGKYAGETFRITENNELVGLTKEQTEEALFDGRFTRLAEVLGERFLHDIEVTDVNPWTEETHRGLGYVKASICGITLPAKEFGNILYQSYVQGLITEKDIAARLYYPKMLDMHEALLRRTLKQQTMDKVEEAARVQVQNTENEKPMRVIYVHQPVHKDQLRAMMAACGFETTPDTFRNLVKDGQGTYSNTTFSVVDNKAMVLDYKDTVMYMSHPAREHIHEALAPHVITEAAVTKINPETGLAAEEGCAFLSCKVFGQKTPPLQIGSSLLRFNERGQLGTVQLAGGMYRDALIDHFQEVKTEVDCGYRWTDGHTTRYCAGHTGEGAMYKDMKAFDEKKGICYISDEALTQREEDISYGIVKPIEEYGYTYTDLVNHARMHALRNPEEVARHCLQNCTWQSPFTELEEFHNCCEIEDLLTLDEEVQDKYDLFVENNGQAPNYAEVFIEYKDDKASQRDMIALNSEAGECADDEVVFTCSSFDDFKRLTAEDNGEDFVVREIYGYHEGNMNGQKRTFDDEHIHDELDDTIRKAMKSEERTIEIDMDMTPRKLKDVLAKEGIQLLDILPGIDEPLPLNKEGGNVAHVYLRVDCDCNSVIDWADEYMYRDARAEDSDTRITKLSQIVNSQEQFADKDIDTLDEGATLVNAEEKEVPWYEDLTRISEVKIFRNPFLHDRDEYRMKCRIDGVQQLGRILFPTQVVELANGADKTEIAAQVFAREMTLNNPNDQSIKAGPGR